MADLLSGWQAIAGTAIVISLILAGIALGLGRAFSFKRLERFGAEEIIQSIINAAILGFAIALSTLILQVGSEFTPQQNLSCTYLNPADYALCSINSTTTTAFALSQNLVRMENVISYYQTLVLNFGNFSIQPLANLASVSTQLSNSLYALQLSAFSSAINAHILSFISSGWFGTIFAAGLVLRSIFLSRKFGAFLIAVALALIIFYPLMLLMFPAPLGELQAANNSTSSFLSNPNYQTIPIIDLNDNGAIADKLYNMSFKGNWTTSLNVTTNSTGNLTNSTVAFSNDFPGDLTLISQQTTSASASLLFYSLIVPLFALIATTVLIKELSLSFAGEIATELTQL